MRNKNNRKGRLLVSILAGVILLGIGYAAITNITLSINGNAKATGSKTDADFVVRFVNATDVNSEYEAVANTAQTPYEVVKTPDVESSVSITGDTTATFSLKDMEEGDTATINYYVANFSNDLSANVSIPTVSNNNEENFEVTVTPTTTTHLAEGEVMTIAVTVNCISQSKLDSEGTFEISFSAEAAE